MVLPVVGLEHHHPLVPVEHLFDVGHAPAELQLRLPLLLLHGVGPLVQGQHQHVHSQAQSDDGQAGILHHPIHNGENGLEQQLQGADEQRR